MYFSAAKPTAMKSIALISSVFFGIGMVVAQNPVTIAPDQFPSDQRLTITRNASHGKAAPAGSVGNYSWHTYESNMLTVATTSGYKIKIQPFTEDLIKVKLFIPGQLTEEPSMPVVLAPSAIAGVVSNLEQQLEFTFGNKKIVVRKNPVSLAYYRSNTLIASESNGFTVDGTGKTIDLNLSPDEQIYGFGSQGIPINRRGYRLNLFTQAKWGYGGSGNVQDLNIVIPFFVSSNNYGVYFDHPYPAIADIGLTYSSLLEYSVMKGEFGYFFVYGEDQGQVLANYTLLTGRQPVPPRWALGYLQSKFGYQSETEARAIVNGIRGADYPLDGLILDLFWYGQPSDMGDLAWDNVQWPTHQKMISDFSQAGIQTILITEPYFITSTSNYASATAHELITKDSITGHPYVISEFWAGSAGLLDLTNPQAKDWMWGFYKSRIDEGIGGWWCDLGEPEIHPLVLKHAEGEALKVHNRYSLHWAQMIFDKYQEVYPGTRVFNLIRSGYAGMQRYGTFPWSGDVWRSYNGLRLQIPIMLGMGMSGVGYMHSDVGGFTGGTHDAELYTRWVQFGVFSPVFRPHGAEIPTEPTSYDQTTQQIVRDFINLRYSLLPYNYSLAFENSLKGIPLARPMNFSETTAALQNLDSQYLWGSNMLIAPVFTMGQTQREVVLPSGKWVDFWTDQEKSGNQAITATFNREKIPVYVRSGSFIPMTRVYRSTSFYHSDSLVIHYYPSENQSRDSMFNDDGVHPQSFAEGQFEIIRFTARPGNKQWLIGLTSDGSFAGKPALRMMQFALHRQPQNSVVWIDSTAVPVYSPASYDTAGLACKYDPVKQILWLKFNWQNQPFEFKLIPGMNGIDPVNQDYARIYPNPVTDILTIEWANYLGLVAEVQIAGMNGRLISKTQVNGPSCSAFIDLTSLKPGLYLLRFNTEKWSKVFKLIKQ
jgi:oligosaccharide 4-alpha-D-glucosyltransferase